MCPIAIAQQERRQTATPGVTISDLRVEIDNDPRFIAVSAALRHFRNDDIRVANDLQQGAFRNVTATEREIATYTGGLTGFFARASGYRATLETQLVSERQFASERERLTERMRSNLALGERHLDDSRTHELNGRRLDQICERIRAGTSTPADVESLRDIARTCGGRRRPHEHQALTHLAIFDILRAFDIALVKSAMIYGECKRRKT